MLTSSTTAYLPTKQLILRAEPRGFEPLTSAVQRLTPMFQPVLAYTVMWPICAVFDVFEKRAFLLRTSLVAVRQARQRAPTTKGCRFSDSL